jgi:hypothetical protein
MSHRSQEPDFLRRSNSHRHRKPGLRVLRQAPQGDMRFPRSAARFRASAGRRPQTAISLGDLPLDDKRHDNCHIGSARAFFTPGIS